MLVDESPRAVPYSRLQHARVNLAPNAEIPRNAIIVRTSKLRSALSDLGLPKTVIINVPGVGYRINKQDAAKITAKVLETL